MPVICATPEALAAGLVGSTCKIVIGWPDFPQLKLPRVPAVQFRWLPPVSGQFGSVTGEAGAVVAPGLAITVEPPAVELPSAALHCVQSLVSVPGPWSTYRHEPSLSGLAASGRLLTVLSASAIVGHRASPSAYLSSDCMGSVLL